MWLGTVAIRASETMFVIAKLLKTTVFSSGVRFVNRHSFSTACTSETTLRKLNSSFNVLRSKYLKF